MTMYEYISRYGYGEGDAIFTPAPAEFGEAVKRKWNRYSYKLGMCDLFGGYQKGVKKCLVDGH